LREVTSPDLLKEASEAVQALDLLFCPPYEVMVFSPLEAETQPYQTPRLRCFILNFQKSEKYISVVYKLPSLWYFVVGAQVN
jgi:hypothetical protein